MLSRGRAKRFFSAMTFTHVSLLNSACRFSIVRGVILLVGDH